MRRAFSAYQFALDHLDEWRVKLSADDRHKALSEAALKAAQVKREKTKGKRDMAKAYFNDGKSTFDIAAILGVSQRTVRRWLKQ